jgi:hypothetical protein
VEPRLGFNDLTAIGGPGDPEHNARLLEEAGAGIQRITLDWQVAEPQRDTYNFEPYDRIYWASLSRGVKPLFTLMYAPSWTWDPLSLCTAERCAYPPARSHLHEWREFVALAAERYPRAAAIEIWNEPNLEIFWAPSPDPGRYAELLREAFGAVGHLPAAPPILGGSLNNLLLNDDTGLSLETFLDAMYRAGAGGVMDGLAFHPYPTTLDLGPGSVFERTLAALDAVLARHGDPSRPLWVTEAGYSTTGSDQRYVYSEEEQADGVLALYRKLRGMRRVRSIVFHALVEPFGPSHPERGWGMVRRDLTRKPAFCALAREVRRAAACP